MSTASNWIEEAQPLLDRFGTGQKAETRRATIIHLAESLAMGSTIGAALKGSTRDKRYVNEMSYYRMRREEPEFAEIMDQCAAIAARHYDMIAAEKVARGVNMQRNAVPVVTKELIEMAVNQDVDPKVRLQAITEILDRAAIETASKAPAPSQTVNVGVAQGISVRDLPLELRREILAHIEAEQDDE